MLLWAVQELEDAPDDEDRNLGTTPPPVPPRPTTSSAIETATSAATETGDTTERLKRLKSLLDNGALSADEYAALRKPLLDSLLEARAPDAGTS